jgi:hypothetical protein
MEAGEAGGEVDAMLSEEEEEKGAEPITEEIALQRKVRLYLRRFKDGRKTKTRMQNAAWRMFERFRQKAALFYCLECHSKEPATSVTMETGVLNYKDGNTSSFRNHCATQHKELYNALCEAAAVDGAPGSAEKAKNRYGFMLKCIIFAHYEQMDEISNAI